MISFCLWMVPCFYHQSHFPGLFFNSFCLRRGINLSSSQWPVTALSWLLSFAESIASALLCNNGVGPCKLARWQASSAEGTGRTPQELAAWACVGPLFLLLQNRCCNVLAEHSMQLTLQLALLSFWQAVPAQSPAESWPIVSWVDLGTPVGSALFDNFSSPAMDQGWPRVTPQTAPSSPGLQPHSL